MDDLLSPAVSEALKVVVGALLLAVWRRVSSFRVKLLEVMNDHASARAVEAEMQEIRRRLAALEGGNDET